MGLRGTELQCGGGWALRGGVKDKLIIYLMKEDNSHASYRCSSGELSRLVHVDLKIKSENIITFEKKRMNKIWVHIIGINKEEYKSPVSFRVKEGLYTLPIVLQEAEQVNVEWVGYQTSDANAIKMLSYFGDVVDGRINNCQHLKKVLIHKCSPGEKLIKGKPNGSKWC